MKRAIPLVSSWPWLVALVVACNSGGGTAASADKTFEGKRAEMAAFVAPVRAAAASLRPLTTDGVHDVKGPLLTWLHPTGNTAVITETQLKEMHTGGDANFMLRDKTHDGKDMGTVSGYGTIEFVEIADWAVGKDSNFHPRDLKSGAEAKTKIDHYLANQYVIVIRFLDYKAPHITSSDATTAKFEPGMLAAEARILDMKGGDHGGFRFGATNSDKISATANRTDEAFAADIEDNARKELDAKLATLVPGSSSLSEFVLGEKPSWEH